MLVDYRNQVLLKYKEKRDSLSSHLIHPTPSSLRTECATLCSERFDQKDEKILRAFFGFHENKKAYIKAIEGFNTGKFKSLQNFLNESTNDTKPATIDLLAWLIDFELRPFERNKKYGGINPNEQEKAGLTIIEKNDITIENKTPTDNDGEVYEQDKDGETFIEKDVNDAEKEVQKVNNDEDAKTKEPVNGSADPRNNSGFITRKFYLIAGIVSVLIALIIYWVQNNNNSLMSMSAAGGCMYWDGDHYQPIPCNEKIDDKLIVALDTVKVKYFRRITSPDTITRNSKGLIWYSKIKGEIEYYTSGGYHPIEIRYRLKPLSYYMIDTHIHPRLTSQ